MKQIILAKLRTFIENTNVADEDVFFSDNYQVSNNRWHVSIGALYQKKLRQDDSTK